MYQKQSFLASIPPVTKNLIIINLLMWLATIVLRKAFNIDIIDYLGLHYPTAENFNAIQLVTYMFLHSPNSFAHLFFNMFSVYMFGRTIEVYWGAKKFLYYYFATGIGAGLIQILVWYLSVAGETSIMANTTIGEISVPIDIYTSMLTTIGASGAVFGILLAFGMLFPNASLFMMFIPIPIKAKYFVIFYGLVELFFGVSNFAGDNIAHFAHLGGMLFGFILIMYWRKKGDNNYQRF